MKKTQTFLYSLTVFLIFPLFFFTSLGCSEQNVNTPSTFHAGAANGNIRLLFTGDIMVHQRQLEIAQKFGTPQEPYNFRPQFAHVKHLLQGDLVVGNFETVVKGKGPYKGYPLFNTPDSLAAALKDANFDVLLLANNHILDHNVQAGLRTSSYLQSQGFTTAGISDSKENLVLPIVNVKGYKFGFINGTYGSNRPLNSVKDPVYVPINAEMDIAADVQNLRSRGADYIIASFHWGAEYVNKPNVHQKKLAEECFAAGVDAVIGHHPHILQPIEILQKNGKSQVVAWSLGNFVSSQRTQPRERTVILALDIKPVQGQGLQLQRVSVAPLWVDLKNNVRVRILPTRFAKLAAQGNASVNGVDPAIFKEIQSSSFLKGKLNAIEQAIVSFLRLPPADSHGFHTVWQRSGQ